MERGRKEVNFEYCLLKDLSQQSTKLYMYNPLVSVVVPQAQRPYVVCLLYANVLADKWHRDRCES